MSTSETAKRTATTALSLALLASLAIPFVPQSATAAPVGDPAFNSVWSRTDRPVQDRMAIRSWTWGPEAFHTTYEPYTQGPAGQHLVSYYDKSRMEINDPSADRNSQWFVTNGLLVVDMIAGRYQVGDTQFVPASPANVPVAGDAAASVNAPTYASLQSVASLNGDHRAANRTGQQVREGLGRNGNIGTVTNLASLARYGVYEPTTGHNIADVFWTFLNQKGIVYQNGQYVNGTLVDWLFAMGYPITEPYWINIHVGDQERWVLMQAFQRRILTYSPQNPEGWKVEMGNVGRAYYDWRYAQAPAPTPIPTATATPRPEAASIAIKPAAGDTNTQITITGKRFPAYAAVMIGVEKADANYFRNIGTVGVRSDGTFTAQITLPDDAARLGEVAITATANAGAVKARATFKLDYAPSISVAPAEVVTNGVVSVQGDGFPANANVDLGAQFSPGNIAWLARIKTNGSGAFEASMPVGSRAIGTTFKVVAVSDGGFKATSTTTHRVLAQPGLQVLPGSGPVGLNVTLRGTNWPPFRAITLGLRASDTVVTAWLPGQITTDGAGNFSVPVYISPEYIEKQEVRLIASEPVSTYRMETSYRIAGTPPTPTPAPLQATVAVNPSVLAIGQVAVVSGTNWQALGVVQVGVGRPGYGVEEWIGSARAAGDRSFSMPFTLGPQWVNIGQLIVTATIPGSKTATTTITVVPTSGRIVPAGLPMTVNTYTRAGATQIKINSNSWQPGSVVRVSVVSADGTVNQEMASGAANNQGIFGAAFNPTAPWAGRADLGVRATTLDGSRYSLRYLPVTTAVKQSGTSNTYEVRGYNWPANVRVDVVVGTDNELKGEGGIVRTISTDGTGAFLFTVNVPRLPGNSKSDLELRAVDQPYSATFDF